MNRFESTNNTQVDPQASRDVATEMSRGDRARMLRAMHVLEAALAEGTPTREAAWREKVLASALALSTTMFNQSNEFDAESGLLQNVIQDAPRLGNRVDELRTLHHAALDSLSQLIAKIESTTSPKTLSTTEVRMDLAEAISTIRKLQATESDIIYEAYQVDLGGGD